MLPAYPDKTVRLSRVIERGTERKTGTAVINKFMFDTRRSTRTMER